VLQVDETVAARAAVVSALSESWLSVLGLDDEADVWLVYGLTAVATQVVYICSSGCCCWLLVLLRMAGCCWCCSQAYLDEMLGHTYSEHMRFRATEDLCAVADAERLAWSAAGLPGWRVHERACCCCAG
jgi:hypothetical protein